MKDYIVRATAANGQIRAFAVTGRQLVEEARQIHNTSPIATAALGRLLMAGSMMGTMMKGEKDVLTLQIKGAGVLSQVVVTADSQANVKGYVSEPLVLLPPNAQGKLDVGGAIGPGMLSVIKDLGLKEPYVGQTQLQTSEIAEDLTYYFANSEQVPSAVGLGVLMEKDNTVKQAGGFIVQVMPFIDEEVLTKLEARIAEITSVTAMLEQGMNPEQILEAILGDLDLVINDVIPTRYACNCSRERVSKALISIGKKELQSIVKDGEDIEMNCHFCGKHYTFTVAEVEKFLKQASR